MTAQQELWRIAESGDVYRLDRVISEGVDVNARNQHGMTALMKAARQGNAIMVRALLERGADPNLKRNDKFTALALAAFFGHTQTVKILIEHGAGKEPLTRCGTSAQMWATARTFSDAARCIESPAPASAPIRTSASAPVVKTLKDPPEIWDLVQEAPRGFNATSAFVSRLKSMNTSFVFRVAAVVVVSAACVVGVLILRGSQAHSLTVEASANQPVVASEVTAPVNVEKTKTETAVDPLTPEVNEFSHHTELSNSNDKRRRKTVSTRQTKLRATPEEEAVQTVENREIPVPAPVVAGSQLVSSQVEPRKSSNRPNSSLSPRLIEPAKSAPSKAKVIQWP